MRHGSVPRVRRFGWHRRLVERGTSSHPGVFQGRHRDLVLDRARDAGRFGPPEYCRSWNVPAARFTIRPERWPACGAGRRRRDRLPAGIPMRFRPGMWFARRPDVGEAPGRWAPSFRPCGSVQRPRNGLAPKASALLPPLRRLRCRPPARFRHPSPLPAGSGPMPVGEARFRSRAPGRPRRIRCRRPPPHHERGRKRRRPQEAEIPPRSRSPRHVGTNLVDGMTGPPLPAPR